MSYNPRTYWLKRYAEQGTRTVGRHGMDDSAVRRQMEVFWQHLKPHFPDECDRLLDFGCGVGRLARHACPSVRKYYGVDLVEQAVETAERFDNAEYIHLPDDRLPFPSDYFDCIVAVTVLQHVVADDRFKLWTRELNRVAEPGCVLLIIDSHNEGDGSGHVLAREPETVADALGAGIVFSEIVSVEKPDSHWAARMLIPSR